MRKTALIVAALVVAGIGTGAGQPPGAVPATRAGAYVESRRFASAAAVAWGRLAGGTALVLGLGCFAAYGLKRLARARRGEGFVEVLEVHPAGHRLHLILVRFGPKKVLLAVTSNAVGVVGELCEQGADGAAEPRSFASLLQPTGSEGRA